MLASQCLLLNKPKKMRISVNGKLNKNVTVDQMGSMMGVTIKESDKEEFTKDVMGSLIDLLVPIYKKHFSEQDLKAEQPGCLISKPESAKILSKPSSLI